MDKRAVRIGSLMLGQGQPAVCIPVMGGSLDALALSAQRAACACADLIELRADSLCAMPTHEAAKAMCDAVRSAAPGIPLLFTLRTTRDGGDGADDAAAYEALLCAVATGRWADAVDCELSVGEAAFSRIVSEAHGAGVPVVGSSHDFKKTPDEEEIVATLAAMERLRADVCKIAVMPRSRMDVLTLMRAAVRCDEELFSPVIAIAMGPFGLMTRIGGEMIGSCLTFGSAGQASAPGQIDAKSLRTTLEIIHNSL